MKVIEFIDQIAFLRTRYQAKFGTDIEPVLVKTADGWILAKKKARKNSLFIFHKPYLKVPSKLNKFLEDE